MEYLEILTKSLNRLKEASLIELWKEIGCVQVARILILLEEMYVNNVKIKSHLMTMYYTSSVRTNSMRESLTLIKNLRKETGTVENVISKILLIEIDARTVGHISDDL